MSGYCPETDTLTDIKSEGLTQYQDMVRLLRWEVDMVRVDILLEIEFMSTYLALTCRGHLKHAFHVFGYLKANPKRKICFDSQHPKIDE